MKARCYSPCITRGIYKKENIQVCDRWRNSFDNFIEDMGEAPENYSIDRINNLGDYCPENCRWADNIIQSKNKSSTLLYEIDGEKLCLKDIAKKYNIKYTTLYNRIFRSHFTLEESINENFEKIKENNKNYSSKYKGISYNKNKNKWQSYYYKNNKQVFVGTFNTEEEAYKVLNECLIKEK